MKQSIFLLFTTILMMCANIQMVDAQDTRATAMGTVTPTSVQVVTRTDSPVKAEVTIANVGTVTFNTTIAFTSDYGYFTFDADNERSDLAPGQSVVWKITYCPAKAGTHHAQLSVNISGSYHLVNFTGTAYARGDANDDGKVSISDVMVLIDYLLNSDDEGVSLIAADCNGDEAISITDVMTLIQYLLNDEWPVEEVEPEDPVDPIEPETETFTVGNVTFTMVAVQGGTFTMGSDDSYVPSRPAHQVTLSSYCIGETEVTQALWKAVMGSNPSYFTGNLQRPVEKVTWYDCQRFINKLNEMTGRTFRFPTEAEWEFAARGGNLSQGYIYAGSDTLDDVAWYDGNCWVSGIGSAPHAVATKAPNELGLYDMLGNVSEWCQDWRGDYSSEAQTNPTGPTSGVMRIARGGNWRDNSCSVIGRGASNPSESWYTYGLRLAL